MEANVLCLTAIIAAARERPLDREREREERRGGGGEGGAIISLLWRAKRMLPPLLLSLV